MIRNLFIFSGVSLAVSLFALAGAAGLVRHDLAAHDWTWTIEQGQHTIHFAKGAPAKTYTPATRSLTWTDTDSLISDVPGDVVYEQGKPAGITVSGPAALVSRVRFEGGRLFLIDGDSHEDPEIITFHLGPHGVEAHANDHDRLKIEVTAPAVTHFSVASDGDLSIRDYDQPALDLSLSGDGDAHVEGATKALTLSVSGDGNAHLDDLRAGDANINLSGDGDAVIAATGKVAINSSGNGDVTLKASPASLISHLSGDGSVNQE